MDVVDGRLDVGYYAGGALLGLRRPEPARQMLTTSLAALPATRVKARPVLDQQLAHLSARRKALPAVPTP